MKRNLEEATVVFNNEEHGKFFIPDVLKLIPEDFNGNVIIMGDLLGEGDIHLKGALWVYGEIEIEGDIEAEFVYAECIVCETIKAEDVKVYGKGIACCEVIVAGDLLSIGVINNECEHTVSNEVIGGTIESEADIEVLGNVLCRDLASMDITIKGDLCVYESIVAGDLSVKGNVYCRKNIMVEDLVVSNNIFCGNNINSEQDIIVKKSVLCKDIEATDIGIDEDLYCEDVTARDIRVAGIIKCGRIQATSINLD